MIVFDTDVLSMFAKIDTVDLLNSKKEIKQILERIKEADNLAVSREVEKEIFDE